MNAEFPTLSRAAKAGPGASFISDFRALGEGSVQMAESICPAGVIPYSSRPEFTLTCTLFAERPGYVKQDKVMKQYRHGDFELAPPVSGDVWNSDGASHFLNLAMPVAGLAPEVADGFARLHEGTFRCPTLGLLVNQLWKSLGPDALRTPLLSEGLYQAVVGQLSVMAAQRPEPAKPGAPLCKETLMRIDDLIAETGDTGLTTRDMADLAGMSVPTFTRRFRATTGQSAHQYVIAQRLVRAQQMLSGSSESVARIAHVCGFSSQSHMTDAFRKRLGTTPGAYRQSFH